jgi:2-oxoisovalerate dehydrogenase E1 component
MTPGDLLARYDQVGWEVRRVAEEVLAEPKLKSAGEVVAPLAPARPVRVPGPSPRPATPRSVRTRAYGPRRSAAGCRRRRAR